MARVDEETEDPTAAPQRRAAPTAHPDDARLPRRPVGLLPLPRIARPDLASPRLTLVTLQSRDAYRTLLHDGVVRARPEHGEPGFREAYTWMGARMRDRLPTDGDGMLWAWARATRRALLQHARQARGEVLVVARVACERVLLSDYLDWHQVLNRSLNVVPLPGERDDAWERRFETVYEAWASEADAYRDVAWDAWPRELRATTETSWDAIFDLDAVPTTRPLQATVHELAVTDVVRAVQVS
nr:DUF3841 domain-containing protein [Cellulosimicrobium aquatile]